MKAVVCFAKSEVENLPVLVTAAVTGGLSRFIGALPGETDSENSQSPYSEPHFPAFRPQERARAGVSWASREKAPVAALPSSAQGNHQYFITELRHSLRFFQKGCSRQAVSAAGKWQLR